MDDDINPKLREKARKLVGVYGMRPLLIVLYEIARERQQDAASALDDRAECKWANIQVALGEALNVEGV